jgi:hypothetical protein
MASGTFATVINCMDGRVKHPVANWMKLNLHVNYVDQVTEPGPDLILTQGTKEQLESVKHKVSISVNAHHSNIIVIAAHHDCAGNPVSDEEHYKQIRQSIEIVSQWGFPISRYIGLWVDSNWQVSVITDTGSQGHVEPTFGVAITCMDGRAKGPLEDWMKQNYLVHYVDIITEPEMDTKCHSGKDPLCGSLS